MNYKPNSDEIYLKYRKFEAGAKGRWAIAAMLLTVMFVVVLLIETVGLW
jgi:hypothetical protein